MVAVWLASAYATGRFAPELMASGVPRFMHDFFEEPLLPGLRVQQRFISADEERQLIAHIEAESLQPFRFQQWAGKRLVKSYGLTYDFQSGAVRRSEPLPLWLLPLRDRAARFAGLD